MAINEDKTELTDNLIKFLRSYYKNQKIKFKEPPTRFGQGQTTKIYKFQLSDIPELPSPLVLRLFKETTQDSSEISAYREGTIQNILNRNDYPAPKAHIIYKDNKPLGGPFIIMDYINGKPMLEVTSAEEIPELLANAHCKLHQINPSFLIENLKKNNIDKKWYDGTVFIDTMIIQNKIDWLIPAVNWIKDNEPKDRAGVICHGDFHPLNILVDQGEIVAVLDWTAARIGEPERDIASTKNILSVFGVLFLNVDWKRVSNEYFRSYKRKYSFDSDKEEYYEAVHCINMLEALEVGFLNEIPGIREQFLRRFTEISDLTLNR